MAKKSGPKATSNKSKKKNKKSGPNKIAMKLQTPKPMNPFESIWTRSKFDTLGKKRKGGEQRVGLARSLAIEKRKKTLLKEYEQKAKSSVFIDKRIGEQNDDLDEFGKAILRSQRERQLKLNKKSKYNLSDGEEEDFDFQGFGSLPGRDDFEDEVPLDDDDEADEHSGKSGILRFNASDGQTASKSGLIEGDENRHKTKKEVMEEIISKSKYFKAQKAKEKEENEQLIDDLDKQFETLRQSAGLQSTKSLTSMDGSNEHTKKLFEQEKPDYYDKLFGEMRMDMRARPSDRTKTPEEIAQEEKERLEELEEERQKRMHATEDTSDEDGDDGEDTNNAKQPMSVSGDDLGDSFTVDEERERKRSWIEEMLRKKNEEGEGEDGTSSEGSESDDDDDEDEEEDEDDDGECPKAQSLKDWEQDDDDLGTDLEEDEEEEEEDDDEGGKDIKVKSDKSGSEKSKKQVKPLVAEKVKLSGKPSNELPFTISAPSSFEEFSVLLENRSDDQIVEAIRRIRTCNAISLAAENRKKMQVFYGVLMQYFAVSANKTPLNLNLLNLLVKPLVEISAELPYFAAICARQRLQRTRTQLCENIKNLDKSCWPSVKTLFLLRLWSIIFPCTDFRHVVMTPAILLMCEYLMRCPITCGRDIAIGSFLCSMLLSVTKQSRKFCPETVAFLQSLLVAAIDGNRGKYKDYQLCHLMDLKALGPMLNIRTNVKEIKPLDFLELINMSEDSSFFGSDDFRASILASIIENLHGLINIYEGFNSFPEIFTPTSKLLNQLAEQEHTPIALRDKIRNVSDFIEKKIKECNQSRRPLQMRKRAPVPIIKELNPKIEDHYVKGRNYDPDRERSEMKKLKKQVKEARKQAARELRKDNSFLFDVKAKEKASLEEEKAEKYGKARAFLQEQEHAFKSGQLGKGKKRRR